MRSDELIEICVTEAGKTFADATAEVDKGIERLAYADVGSWLRYPIGAVGAVSPVDFPVMIPIVQFAVCSLQCAVCSLQWRSRAVIQWLLNSVKKFLRHSV